MSTANDTKPNRVGADPHKALAAADAHYQMETLPVREGDSTHYRN